jgi:hypothetical protein
MIGHTIGDEHGEMMPGQPLYTGRDPEGRNSEQRAFDRAKLLSNYIGSDGKGKTYSVLRVQTTLLGRTYPPDVK